jgi:hypothetical protein
MRNMPKRDEDCWVHILALVHGGPTTTNEIVRPVDGAAGLSACDLAIRGTARARSIQVERSRGTMCR